MLKKNRKSLPIYYILPLIYISIILILLPLKFTSLNYCIPSGLSVLCSGPIEIIMNLVSFPGWFIMIMLLFLSSNLSILDIIYGTLSSLLRIDQSKLFFILPFIISPILYYLLGKTLENKKS